MLNDFDDYERNENGQFIANISKDEKERLKTLVEIYKNFAYIYGMI